MNNEFPSGLLFYVLIFAAVLLFNYATRRIEAWRKRQELLSRAGEPPSRVQKTADTIQRGRRAAAGEPQVAVRRVGTRAVSPTAPTATDARLLVTGRRNLRRAVIAMTVLGPCKSQERL
jgi:hypothetical protein